MKNLIIAKLKRKNFVEETPSGAVLFSDDFALIL
jgi:hypothetical protein